MPSKKKAKFDWEAQQEVLPPATEEAGYLEKIGKGIAQGAGDVGMLLSLPEAGLNKLASMFGGGQGEELMVTPGQAARYKAAQDPNLSDLQRSMLLEEDDDIAPMLRMPGARTAVGEDIESLSTGSTLQEGTRRITRSLPGLAGGPALFAEMSVRDLAGLGGRKIAEKLGLGETAQDLFDLGFSLTPNPKKFIEGGSKVISKAATGEYTTQKQMVEAARNMGWSEQEIAPLVREGWFANTLKKLSPRGAATEKALDKTAAAVTSGFEHVKDSKEALTVASQGTKNKFVKNVENILPDLTEKAKKAIGPELETLYKGEMAGKDFISFWQKTNRYFGELPELQSLKGPTGKAIREVSSDLANKFEMANTLSQRFRTVSKQLKPNLLSQLVTGGELIFGLKSLLSFQLPISAGGVAGSRKLAELMTTNPRFMNLHKKMLTSVNTGQAKAAEHIMNSMINMVSKESPQMAREIRKTSMEELRELLQASSMEEDLD